MDNKQIIDKLIQRLTAEGIWFTTENDPTYGIPVEYYSLDEYGDLTEKSIDKIAKEIKDYIGNGAYDIDEAIQLWLDNASMEFTISYEDNLVSKFKPKEVVDGIEAFETPNNLLKESRNYKDYDEMWSLIRLKAQLDYVKPEDKIEDKYHINIGFRDSEERSKARKYYKDLGLTVYNGDVKKGFEYPYQLYLIISDDQKNEIIKESKTEATKVDGVLTSIPDSLMRDSSSRTWNDDEWKNYYYRQYKALKDTYEATKSENRSMDNTIKYFQDKAKSFNIDNLQFNEETIEDDFDKISKAYADKKKNDFEKVNKKVESLNRLHEENTKSLNLISSKFTDSDFDSDSPEGQIVMRTSELFNALSDKGYDVQVSFDNGQSQCNVLLSRLGGQVIITIMNANQPLRSFITGNMEITDDMLDTLKDIKDQVEAI